MKAAGGLIAQLSLVATKWENRPVIVWGHGVSYFYLP